ncbi:MAG: MBL fold metallo-hydrolase [Lachnospiraceae bacterium]|nr:MBL fold metallo-hydrolase [Lachnospiraceae bacterium]
MPSKYAFIAENLEHFYRYPQEYYMKPFRIYGNLWFVGNRDVGSYLFDTPEGLILIDTTYPETRAQMIQSIWEAGFNPRDIRYILHTHGHFDHFGATDVLVALSGAETFLGEEDAKMFSERPELALISDAHHTYLEPFRVDHAIRDGDVITLGGTSIRCISCPGHTLGVMCFVAELEENGIKKTAGLYGGIGTGTVCREFVEKMDTWAYREHFIDSLEKVRHEKIDITLGNHTAQNATEEKRRKMLEDPDGPNPFIDPSEWERFIEGAKEKYLQMLRDEEAGTDQI